MKKLIVLLAVLASSCGWLTDSDSPQTTQEPVAVATPVAAEEVPATNPEVAIPAPVIVEPPVTDTGSSRFKYKELQCSSLQK